MGYIHSIQTFGTVDGPGIRFVIFFQGCPMRCLYCHNPDTWDFEKGDSLTSEELLSMFNKNKVFYKNGGITVSGGEPLYQIDFLLDLFKKAKQENIHTCLDTSGILFNEEAYSYNKIKELMSYTDLILLDIKHINNVEHKKLTGFSNENVLRFLDYLQEINKDVWIRHVVVPELTYNEKYLKELGEYLSTFKNIEKIEILPYHNLGKYKYKELGIEYPLKNTKELSNKEKEIATKIVYDSFKKEVKNGN